MRLVLLLLAVWVASADVGQAQSVSSGSSASDGEGRVMSHRQRTNPMRSYQLGVDALFIGDYARAIDLLREAHRAFPNDHDASYALGLAYFAERDFENAKEPFEHAVNRENAPALARLHLGLTYLQLGERRNAIDQQRQLADSLRACGCDDYQRDRLTSALNDLTAALDAPDDRRATPSARI